MILQTIIEKHPILTINQVPLLLIAPSISYSRESVENIAKYVFESMELTAFNVLDLSVAATFGLGLTSAAVVVNIGKHTTQIMPVVSGTPVTFAGVRLPVGGSTIDAEIAQVLPKFTASQIEALKTSGIYELLSESDTSFYSLADLSESTRAPEDEEFDVAKLMTEEEHKANVESKPNSELEVNSFVDPESGLRIVVGKERFQGSAGLVLAISDGLFQSLEKVPDLDKRQQCYDNIVIVGGTSVIPGLKKSIVMKLYADHLAAAPQLKKKGKNDSNGVSSAISAYQLTEDAVENTGDNAGALQVPSSVRLAKHPEYFPEWKLPKSTQGSWHDVYFLGAQIYAKQVFASNSNHGRDSFLDTEIYEERGPEAIWNVRL